MNKQIPISFEFYNDDQNSSNKLSQTLSKESGKDFQIKKPQLMSAYKFAEIKGFSANSNNHYSYCIKITITILVILGLVSCMKKPQYESFSEKDLDFVTYYSATQKTLKFIDTSGVTKEWRQTDYNRDFHELTGFYGRTGNLQEEYYVRYLPITGSGELYISVSSASLGQPDKVSVEFYEFHNEFMVDNLNQEVDPIKINGTAYSKVYKLKMYTTRSTFRDDSAIVLYNRDYGLIQMIYSNGKTITRTD